MPQRYACWPMGLEQDDPRYFETIRAMKPPQGWRALGGDDVQRLHELYYDPQIPLPQIAQAFCVSPSTLMRWIAEIGWPSRRALRLQSAAALREHGAALRSDPDEWDDERMRAAIAAAVQREADFAAAALEGEGDAEERERRARALALLTRAMLDLKKLDDGRADPGDPYNPYQERWQRDPGERPPRSLEVLREELARKLQRIMDEEDDAGA